MGTCGLGLDLIRDRRPRASPIEAQGAITAATPRRNMALLLPRITGPLPRTVVTSMATKSRIDTAI